MLLELYQQDNLQNGRLNPMSEHIITEEKFDRRFEAGGDMRPYLDLKKAKVEGIEKKKINLDMPEWIIEGLDEEAQRLGITRQLVIKTWLAERLDRKVG